MHTRVIANIKSTCGTYTLTCSLLHKKLFPSSHGFVWLANLTHLCLCCGILCRKKLFQAVHMFVHLNLAISLLLGYLIFMLGIETAISSSVSIAATLKLVAK